MLAYPRLPQRRRERLRRIPGEPMRLLHSAERRAAGLALGRRPARQLPRRLPRRIGLHRAATLDELAQHRVIHPGAGEKPGANVAALHGIRAQRPRPHMGGRGLRALTRTRLTPTGCGGSAAGVGSIR